MAGLGHRGWLDSGLLFLRRNARTWLIGPCGADDGDRVVELDARDGQVLRELLPLSVRGLRQRCVGDQGARELVHRRRQVLRGCFDIDLHSDVVYGGAVSHDGDRHQLLLHLGRCLGRRRWPGFAVDTLAQLDQAQLTLRHLLGEAAALARVLDLHQLIGVRERVTAHGHQLADLRRCIREAQPVFDVALVLAQLLRQLAQAVAVLAGSFARTSPPPRAVRCPHAGGSR